MTAYVEECRQEWKRLRVPDRLAEEMATELETDLAEAEADGVSAAEMLGESDPRRFAAAWARERGLVADQPPKKSRKRLWIVLAVCLVLLLLLSALVAGGLLATTSVQVQAAPPVKVSGIPQIGKLRVPELVGLKACDARRVAVHAGLEVQNLPRHSCHAVVVAQMPAAGAIVPRHTPLARVTLRLRARR
jgi:hypothetical protein